MHEPDVIKFVLFSKRFVLFSKRFILFSKRFELFTKRFELFTKRFVLFPNSLAMYFLFLGIEIYKEVQINLDKILELKDLDFDLVISVYPVKDILNLTAV